MALPVGASGAPATSPQGGVRQPKSVTIAGNFQHKLGCPHDWQPDCSLTHLTFSPVEGIWKGTFELPAGDHEYKVAIDDSWDENYGFHTWRNGPNITFTLMQPAAVTFLYDHHTHWIADSVSTTIAAVIGTFQCLIGSPEDNAPDNLNGWLQDPDSDGLFTFITEALPAGSYEARVALDQRADEVYGAGGVKAGDPIPFTVKEDGDEVYFAFDPATKILIVSPDGPPRGDLTRARAYWVARDTILWDIPGSRQHRYRLHSSLDGRLELMPRGIVGGESIELSFSPEAPGAALAKFPHLAGLTTLKIAAEDMERVPSILRGEVAITAYNPKGRLVDATRLQLPGALDDLYRYDGPLGVSIQGGIPMLRVWAPTARNVRLLLFDDADPGAAGRPVQMELDPATGVWTATGDGAWLGLFYLYEVEVYMPLTGQIETNLVTDPYSISLATNSTRSQIVDLDDPALKPEGWDALRKPDLAAPTDIVLYELHVRDFSISDETVPEELRGTFKAFTAAGSNGMRHLRALAEAGLTHVHLLPAFDIATIEEDRARRREVDPAPLRRFPPDSDQQQALVAELREYDGYNWGYDPFHYCAPEGSYSTQPDGPARIREFREMVKALGEIGLRVVMDVVYNHTYASGVYPKAVLDKVVPSYYHRLDENGYVTSSTCCDNTATEHAMMEKLMIDSLVLWARAYKVDGFRFDLMGHHMRSNMIKARETLRALTPERDGVDGSKLYIYGEGWDFGEVAHGRRGPNASQLNMPGTRIGTFNDRLRDAVRGGGAFSGIQDQGYATGLWYAPNWTDQGMPDAQLIRLAIYTDRIKVGLAGNLKHFWLVNYTGYQVTGEHVGFNGAPTGYALHPEENVVYVSAHDNETLFDAIQLKASPETTLAERIRMHNLAMSLVALSQGVPFFHAGDDMLRSKSLDRNSYDSGDWFNRLDFSYESNNWGVGLPPAGDNQYHWPVMGKLLANPDLKPGKEQILGAVAHLREMLRIRKSSRLFRLETAEAIIACVTFYNDGPEQIPGLIVMSMAGGGQPGDVFGRVVVLFNASNRAHVFRHEDFAGAPFQLHPVQAESHDPIVRTASYDTTGAFAVPAYTTAVFVAPPESAGQPASTAMRKG